MQPRALPRYPALFQVNTRVRLWELGQRLGLNRSATLDEFPDADIDRLAKAGFDIVWLLGVWQTGPAARLVSATNADLVTEYRHVLPDFRDADVVGSPFAVRDYHVHADFGGDAALARLRERLRARELRLMLDFVPNHVAPDHAWVDEHPDFFIEGTDEDLLAQPRNWRRFQVKGGERILAYGRDPYFAGWSDTLQLNYGNLDLQDAMLGELQRIAAQCDGVRCDMAMLELPDVFERTWGIPTQPFWPRATAATRGVHPGFTFMAEVYWDLEWTLQQQGFDYTYDKRLYDRLRDGDAAAVRGHLHAGLDFQDHLARFLENHDEPRAAATFEPAQHRAAAVITFFAPGLRFIHQGEREGRTVHIPMHLARGPNEAIDAEQAVFYDRVLACLGEPAFRDGQWQLLDASPAWEGNGSNDAFICYAWTGTSDERRLVVANYAAHQSQSYVRLPWSDLVGWQWRLLDALGDAVYERDGRDLDQRGLYLDLAPWGYHVFEVRREGLSPDA
ncbi:MAG TPA: alpha-amylase family glycosyl hydrolase [Candidatus Limnocylindrales bacterium]|jgi:glycosidase